MSGKRRATNDLNHDNWDREVEPETMGTFEAAPEDELKNRVIKKARRKLTGQTTPSDDSDGQRKSVFSSFTGFGKMPSNASTHSTLPTLSATNTTNSDKLNSDAKPTTMFSFLTKFTPPASEPNADVLKVPPTSDDKVVTTNNNNYSFSKSNTYYAKLKGLNQAVSNWIKTHVDTNPLCLLTPIFKDYEKYLDEIEKNENSPTKIQETSQSKAMSGFTFSTNPTPASMMTFNINNKDSVDASFGSTKSIFGSSTSQKPESDKSTNSSISLHPKSESTTSPASSMFPSSTGSGFSFSGGKPFSFGSVAPPPPAEANADKENDEEDEPPKVEFKAVVEEDSVYSKRCKVFVKNEGDFADRGVGTLYLKPVKDSEKMQLIVRADTNLGNILVNLILNDSIPTQRMGKNNVMLVCIPNADVKKPTPMLLRVKTAEEADELLATIDKHKK